MMASRSAGNEMRAALIVVDVQEDFCPPNGSLAVEKGRDVAPIINKLLNYPFLLKIATQDFHPSNHISFATAHDPPDNLPFQSKVSIRNLVNPQDTNHIPLWPEHCVQGTKGAEIIPEIDVGKIDHIIRKGMDPGSEMFSAFADTFGNKRKQATSQDLASLLKSHGITHVFTSGIAGDYCVKCTSLDARKEGYEVLVVQDAVRSVDPSLNGWDNSCKEMEAAGIKVVSLDGPELMEVGSQDEQLRAQP